MIILLPKKTEYKIGEDFPFLTIPLEMENSESASFEDFQWWAKSDDFRKWLKDNPREWVADSEDMGKYDDLTEYLKENYSLDIDNIDISVNEETGVVTFSEFIKINEETAAKSSDDPEYREAIKFHFAYNKLRSEGKIDETLSSNEIPIGSDKAIFICGEDPNTGDSILETLKAIRATGFSKTSSDSKITLLNVTEMIPGGPITDDETAEGLTQKIIKDATILAAMGGAGVVLFGALKIAGSAWAGNKLLKTISGFAPSGAARSGAAGSAGLMSKFKSYSSAGIKSLWGTAKGMALLKNTRTVGSSVVRGAKGAKAAYTLGKVGSKGAIKAFGKGLSRGAAQGGAKLIPFVGEVLMVVDAVGSTWNWFSDNQAPKYKEVKSFAYNEMDPKKIPIGVPITVCWSQPSGGGWGSVTSFLFNNETRTTAEFIKIANKNNFSILILTQVNSKSVQKQLAQHDLILIALDNNDIVNDQGGFMNTVARIFDNEDLDFKISYIDGISKIATIFNFQGMCDWNLLLETMQNSSDQLIVTDTSAPETYDFYYEDTEDNIINVSGRIMTNEELRSTSQSDIEKIFLPKEDKTPYGTNPGEKKQDSKNESSEYIDYTSLVDESDVITSFSDFNTRLNPYNSGSISEAKAESEEIKLNKEQLSGPAKVAIYWVTDREYADPDLRKYKAGLFTNFTVDPKDYKAKNDQSIEVEVNTVGEDIENPKRGTYTVKKVKVDNDKKDEDGKIEIVVKPKTEDEPEKINTDSNNNVSDDYYIKVDPKDVQIKDRRSSTVIKDNSVAGGINLIDKFLTNKEREILGIQNWKSITFAKALQDNRGDVVEVKLKNRFASFGDKTRKYRVTDGESFQIAKKFSSEVEERIKYE
jgi:hypothetical protein